MKKQSLIAKVGRRMKADNEKGARENLMEEMFYDFNRSRVQIYKMNFVRGLFFGLGSVLGGTIVVALLIWILSAFVNVFPPLADFINGIIDAMRHRAS
jgi:hypothetical protein